MGISFGGTPCNLLQKTYYLGLPDRLDTWGFFLFFFNLFLAALGLRCCAPAFSSCGERGLLFVVVRRASHYGGFSCCRAWALGARASVVVACGL